MQPCSSLLTMDLVQSSTAFFSFFDRESGSFCSVRSSSFDRMASALARSACQVISTARSARGAYVLPLLSCPACPTLVSLLRLH